MKTIGILTTGLLAGLAASAPTKKQNLDPTVLQFALTLEHLENVFYKQALSQFSEAQFMAAGYSASYYNNLKYIAADEQSHVMLLTSALQSIGQSPVAACTYSFPYTDVKSFIGLSSVLEGVGTSAYLGGAPLISSKDYLTVAGSILVTEALHTSFQRNAVGEVPFPTPYGTPLDPTSVYTLAAAFIKSCPSSNVALPFKPFPSLTYTGASASCYQGETISLKASASLPSSVYVTYVSGLTVTSVMGTASGYSVSAAVPASVAGQTYVFVTSADVETKFDDSKVLAGPAIIEVAPGAPQINFGYYKE